MRAFTRQIGMLALCYAAWACTDLADLGAECGNGIVDRQREDCDSSDPSCRPPGAEGECRFDCSFGDDGERRACPPGMGCGRDSICRAASGQFTAIATTFAGSTLRLESGDLDGDGATDIIASNFGGIQVLYFEPNGSVATVTPAFDFQFSPIAVGPLARHADSPNAPDALINARGNVSVYLGQTDRTLSTKSYASIPIEVEALRYVVIEGLPTDAQSLDYGGSEILAAVPTATGTFLMDVFGGQQMFALDLKLADVARGLTSANLLPASPCDELIATAPGRDHVAIYEICHQSGDRWVWKKDDHRVDLALPGGAKIAQPPDQGASNAAPDTAQSPLVLAADLNDDEHLDLLTLAALADSRHELVASYGVGNGTFHSSASLPTASTPGAPVPPGDGAFGVYQPPYLAPRTVFRVPSSRQPHAKRPAPPYVVGAEVYGMAALPLAVGSLTDDGKPDFVTSLGVIYSTESGGSCFGQYQGYDCLNVSVATPLSKAAIRDFNGNGRADVVALDSNARTLHFLNGTGTGFVPSAFSSSGFVRDFAIGDFDGDLLQDIALHELSLTKAGVLSVLYSRPFAPPNPPVTLAKFPEILQIGAGLFDIAGLDAIEDIGVLSRSTTGALGAGLFSGSSDRRVQSPFTLFFDEELAAAARGAVVGRFDGDAHADLAILSGPTIASAGPGVEIDQHVRLWLLPSVGEAELDANTISRTEPLDALHEWCGVRLVSIDLDADGIDELVALATQYTGEARPLKGSIANARASADADGKRRFSIARHALMDELFLDGFATIECASGVQSGGAAGDPSESDSGLPPMSSAWGIDVNRDGLLDLLTLAYIGGDPGLVAYLNDGAGSLDLENPLRLQVDLPAGDFDARLMGVAPLQADADPELELILVISPPSPEGPDGGAFLVDLATLDLATGKLAAPQRLLDVPSFALTVGDFNGDGVDDFASATVEGIQLVLGTAVLP